MPTNTTNLSLIKPNVNDPVDQDLWGTYLNTNMDTLDTAYGTIPLGVPVATVLMYAGSTAPTGYLECNGQSTASYAALAAIVGATVPDLRGYFVRGWDHGAGVDTGRTIRSTQTDNNKTHTHTATSVVTDAGHAHGYTVGGAAGGAPYTTLGSYHDTLGSGTGGISSATTGITVATTNTASGGTESRPKNVALMFIIKT